MVDGNLVLIGVEVPVVVWLANKLLRPVLETRSYANDILEHGVNVTGELDAVPNLERTAQLAAAARQGVTRCGDALRGLR